MLSMRLTMEAKILMHRRCRVGCRLPVLADLLLRRCRVGANDVADCQRKCTYPQCPERSTNNLYCAYHNWSSMDQPTDSLVYKFTVQFLRMFQRFRFLEAKLEWIDSTIAEGNKKKRELRETEGRCLDCGSQIPHMHGCKL